MLMKGGCISPTEIHPNQVLGVKRAARSRSNINRLIKTTRCLPLNISRGHAGIDVAGLMRTRP
jgi:hypothetical protein